MTRRSTARRPTPAVPPPTIPLEERLLTLAEVCQLAGLGKTSIYRLVRERTFPAPFKPGGVASRWSGREVIEWRRAQEAARAA